MQLGGDVGKWLDHEDSDLVQVLVVGDFTVCQAVGRGQKLSGT